MRILLINPFYPISETPSPPLGLAYLAAALEAAGHEVKILDFVVYPYSPEMLEAELESFRPQMAGATAVTMTFDHAAKVIAEIKDHNPAILTVMGGPHVTFCAGQTLKSCPQLDVVARGEGERTIVELADGVAARRDLASVAGISFRRGAEICTTAERQRIRNLDELPAPARHLLALGRYRALGMPISLTTSRGCPFKCIFCVGRKMVGARVRYRSPQKVADELQYLSRLAFHQVNIADDLFTANPHHCLAVCDEILRRKLKLKWTSFARVDTVSEPVLAKMRTAGCTAVSFGVETANAQILKTIKKGITTEQVIEAVKMCRRTGVTPYASFILGLPGETPETLQETLDFAAGLKDLGLSYGFHLLAPFPGTEVRQKSQAFGLRILTGDWSRYHANSAIVETAEVNCKMLDEIAAAWKKEYDEFLADIIRRRKDNTAAPDEIRELENLERIVLIYDLMMKRVIETKGNWRAENPTISQSEAFAGLVQRIGQETDAGADRLRLTLQHAWQHKNLTCRQEDGKIQWKWADTLPAQ